MAMPPIAAVPGNVPWPPQTSLDVQRRLALHLRALADLAGYLGDPGDSGRIVIRTYWHEPGCSTQPVPSLDNTAVRPERLGRAIAATEVLNRAMAAFEEVDYDSVQAACVTPDGQDDLAATLAVGELPRLAQEPLAGRLPRRTPDQVRIAIAVLLQAGAEIAPCFVDADDGMTVRIRADLSTVGADPVPLGEAVDKDGLGRLQMAVMQLNAALPLDADDTEVFEREAE